MRWNPRSGRLPNWSPTAADESWGWVSDLVERAGHRGFLVSRLVLVNHALAGRLVQLAVGRDQQLRGLLFLATVGGLPERADGGTQRGLHRLVAQAGALVRLDALLLRLDVGHA